ncbi:hypothetical protein [Fictibacillus nanhaiensis]|uniref:hypothetical protein n=1 Tax=Fictibacillus nanhaiensis TaxID=742169 RepID=UPI003C257BCF
MDHQFSPKIQEALDHVKRADEAMIEAQANQTPSCFQTAKVWLETAQQSVHDAGEGMSEEEKKQMHHAKEFLRHLHETQAAIQETRYD